MAQLKCNLQVAGWKIAGEFTYVKCYKQVWVPVTFFTCVRQPETSIGHLQK